MKQKIFPRFVEDFYILFFYSPSRQGMKATEGRKKINTSESINTSSALNRMKISLIKKMLNCFDVGKMIFLRGFRDEIGVRESETSGGSRFTLVSNGVLS